ncbi:MAG TPA: histidine phosphatase family protein [Gemmataceae bacterium]
MSSHLPRLFLTRHGDTPWTESRQHTGRTDLALNERGEHNARLIGERLRKNYSFDHVFTSPLQRATKTCELAGYGEKAEIDADLVEWDYGAFEGRRGREIRKERPGWLLFRDGCPGGESPEQVAARADRFIARIRDLTGDILAFSSGHVTRMIAARWLGLPPGTGRFFYCRPASVGVLAYEHDSLEEPIIFKWNYMRLPRE